MADGLSYVPFKPALGLVEHIALHIEHQIVAGVLRSGDRIQEALGVTSRWWTIVMGIFCPSPEIP